ncbi:MAG: alpha/beta hydrolase [Silicimonas sp.]|nr:alpha/beta hydrolase [Silicimonas sp.]
MMLRVLLPFFLLLSACTPPPVLAPLPEGAEAGREVAVLVAHNRTPTEEEPTFGREEELRFEKIAFSVPPDRRPGSITTPVGRAPNAETDFLVTDRAEIKDARAFRRALSARLRRLPPKERDVLIYVHGFNQAYGNGVLRMAQLSYDLKVKGVALHFSWPSAANPFAYVYDRDSALFSRDALEEMIRLAQVPEARSVAIVAHSMGSFLTMETLRQMDIAQPGSVAKSLDGVILMSPDIDVDVFRNQAEKLKDVPGLFAVFLSDRDRALALSARLTGQRVRLGNLDDPSRLGDLEVVLVDVTAFSEGDGHSTPLTSPALIQILANAGQVDNAFAGDAAGRSGLLPGTIITVQNVTEFVLTAGTSR